MNTQLLVQLIDALCIENREVYSKLVDEHCQDNGFEDVDDIMVVVKKYGDRRAKIAVDKTAREMADEIIDRYLHL